jgi:hypothetical protein
MWHRIQLVWWSAPWLLLLLPLLVRWLPLRGEPQEQRWRWTIDLPLAAVLGLGLTLCFSAFMVHPLPDTFPVSASDFDHYCEMVARVADGSAHEYYSPRFPPPAWLPASVSPALGIIDGLALQSFLALSLTLASLYLWGLAVHGRAAGIMAAGLAAAVVPLVFLVRDLTFYSVLVAGVAAMGASLALAVRLRGVGACLALGLACGATLLADVRAPIYVGPVVVLGALVALLRGRGWGGRGLRLLVLVAPLLLSWFVAHRVVSPDTTGLEQQAVMYLEHAVREAGGRPDWRQMAMDEILDGPSFLWGQSSPTALPEAALRLQRLSASLPAALSRAPNAQVLRSEYVVPWGLPALVALLVVVALERRRPWRLVALAGGTLPCLLMLYSVFSALPQERHLASALLPVPLLFGVFLARATQRGKAGGFGGGPGRWPWRSMLLLLLLALVLLGVPGSWLSPTVRWRRNVVQTEPRATLQAILDGTPRRSDHCTWALTRDAQQPGWPSRFYPAARVILDRHRGESQGH